MKLTYHSIGPKPWSLMSSSAVSAGSAASIAPMPSSSRFQNSIVPA